MIVVRQNIALIVPYPSWQDMRLPWPQGARGFAKSNRDYSEFAMHLIYIDESNDGNKVHIFSALCIHEKKWKQSLSEIRLMRKSLRKDHGIYLDKELHAWKFCAGKGQIANRPISKSQRSEIFNDVLRFMVGVDGFALFNAINANEQYSFERLMNRINRTMKERNSRAILIFDEGKEPEFRRRIRRMSAYNPIPSSIGKWNDTGDTTKNIPLEHIIEDPFFKNSEQSYFIQLVDFAAYALLRKERPLQSRTVFGYDKSFEILSPICVKEANRNDPNGIIR